MNRDYFTKPNQGNGRDFHGYGNTSLKTPRRPSYLPLLIALAVIAAVGWIVM